MSEFQIVKKGFAAEEDGQIVLYEGCKGCGKSRLNHHPIKLPRVEWEWDEEADIPTMTRWYDLYCYHCAKAILSSAVDPIASEYLKKHGLQRLIYEDVLCPKMTKEEILKKMKS